jgi:high-affinity nickel permease
LHGGLWRSVSAISLGTFGYLIAGVFVATWVGSVAVSRLRRIDERSAAGTGRA